jgi:hypothetical protein
MIGDVGSMGVLDAETLLYMMDSKRMQQPARVRSVRAEQT